MNPLKTVMNTDEGLMEWQIDDIFGNIEEIKEASDKMSRALQLCQLADPQYFGQVFLNRVRPPYTCDITAPHPLLIDDRTPTQMEDLQKYEEVCVHQQIATDALQEALHSHKAFRSFCEVRPKPSPERTCEFELNRTPPPIWCRLPKSTRTARSCQLMRCSSSPSSESRSIHYFCEYVCLDDARTVARSVD